MKNILNGMMAITLLFGVQTAGAATLTIPNTFTANTPAIAAEVNANFAATVTSVNDIEARLAALEVVTNTNMAVTPLQKAAGTWAFMLDIIGGGQFVPNLVDLSREVVYGTVVVNAAGTFTLNETGGHRLAISLFDKLISKTVVLPKADGTLNKISQAVQVDQKGLFGTSAVPAGGGTTGTISIGVGNRVTMQPAAVGAPVFNGYISQNGQIMVLQGNIAADSRVFILTKIQ